MTPPAPPATQPLADPPTAAAAGPATPAPVAPLEIGGRPGPDPTRYGDWELKGRCIDF